MAAYGGEIYSCHFRCEHIPMGNRASQLSETDNVVLSGESVRNTRSTRTQNHVTFAQRRRNLSSSSENTTHKSEQGQRDKYSKSKNANEVTSGKKDELEGLKITAARTYVRGRPVHTNSDSNSQNVEPRNNEGERSQLRRSYELMQEEEEEQINGLWKNCTEQLENNQTFWQKFKRRLRLQQTQTQQDRIPLCNNIKDSSQSNDSFCVTRCLKEQNSESGLEVAYKEKEEKMSQTTDVGDIKIDWSFMDDTKPMKFNIRRYQKFRLEFPCKKRMEAIKEEHHYENVGIWNEIKTRKYDESHHALLTYSPIHSTNVYNSKPKQVMLNDRFHKQNETKIKDGDMPGHREEIQSKIEDPHYVNIPENMRGAIKKVYSQNTRKKAKNVGEEKEVQVEHIYQNVWQNETPIFDDHYSDEDVTVSSTKALVHQEDVSKRSSLDNMKHCTRDLCKQNEPKFKKSDFIEWDEIQVLNQEKDESKQEGKVLSNIDIVKQEEKKMEPRMILLPRRRPRTLKQKACDLFGIKRNNSKQQDRKRGM